MALAPAGKIAFVRYPKAIGYGNWVLACFVPQAYSLTTSIRKRIVHFILYSLIGSLITYSARVCRYPKLRIAGIRSTAFYVPSMHST